MSFVYKIILLFAALLATQGIVLPWVISNKVLPLWADLTILTGIGFLWVYVIQNIVSNAIKNMDKNSTHKD